jgi:hypothetical protein
MLISENSRSHTAGENVAKPVARTCGRTVHAPVVLEVVVETARLLPPTEAPSAEDSALPPAAEEAFSALPQNRHPPSPHPLSCV